MKSTIKIVISCIMVCLAAINVKQAAAQTERDALMMSKNNFCGGLMYSYNSWDNYWEGNLKRNNLNLGTVTTQQVMFGGAYGISNKLNIIVGVPYVFTKSTAGTLNGQNNFQDLSLSFKWQPLKKTFGKSNVNVFAVAGMSFPLSNYTRDFLPMSIGIGSTNFIGRIISDYKLNKLFVTASGSYIRRSNIAISRNSYYTTQLFLTNQVEIPDATFFSISTGYRSKRVIAEANLNNWTTIGGFDIRRNDMPFPSNRMNALTAGVNVKYYFKKLTGLSFTGGGDYCIEGRNVGQGLGFNGGFLYQFNLKKGKPSIERENI